MVQNTLSWQYVIGVKLALRVHVGMTNSLVALNLEIGEISILFVASKGKKGVKRDPKLQNKTPYFHNNCSIRVESLSSQNVSYLQVFGRQWLFSLFDSYLLTESF